MPSPIGSQAASKDPGSLYRSPCTMMAQAIRAILVGQGDRCHLRRAALHQSSEPWPLQRAVLLRVADDGHRAGDEQPSQVAIALFGDAAELVLATGRLLFRYQANPGSQAAPRPERLPVTDLGNQSRGDNRTDARYLLQPPARLARTVPDQDTPVDRPELS